MEASQPTASIPGPIALLGATGAIGRTVAASLHLEGRPYRVVGRDAETLKRMFEEDPQAERKVWDPDEPSSIRAALRGIRTAVYTVGVRYTSYELHPILMRRVLDAAIAEGIERLLLVTNLYVFGRRQTDRVDESHPREPHTFKGKKRKEQEDMVLAADNAKQLQATVLRLPDFYGPGVDTSLLLDLFTAVKEGRKARLIGPIDRPHEFVFVPDVGPVIVRMLRTPAVYGQAWNLGGAGAITQRELASMAYGGKPRVLVAGATTLRLMALVNPFFKEILDMHYLMTEPLIVDDSALRSVLGDIPKTPYVQGVSETVEAQD